MPALILRDIPSRPEWGALAARMSVQWGDAAVEGIDNQWKALGPMRSLNARGKPAPTRHPKSPPKLRASSPEHPIFTPNSAASPITSRKNVRYFIVERGIGGWQANHAADIFRNRYGDCKDKTTLLISMLQVGRYPCRLHAGG